MFDAARAAAAPYLLAIKFIGAALLVGAVFFGGCSVQKGRDAKRIDGLTTKLADARTALDAAGKALDGASDALRAVNRQAQANIAEAAAQAQRAAAAAEQARKDRAASQRKVDALEATLRKERETCPESRMKLCGIPLR